MFVTRRVAPDPDAGAEKHRGRDLIDFDAGRIATGEMSIEAAGWDLFRLILDVASGRTKVWSERWGIHNDLTLFNPAPVT